jgi:tetratricopeptide (TPR) repeat protein
MKEWILIPSVSIGLAVFASALTGAFTSGRADVQADARASSPQVEASLDELSRSLQELTRRNDELERRLADVASLSSSPARTELGGLDAAVARWMERNAAAPGGDVIASAGPANNDTVHTYLGQLLSGDLTGLEAQELWQKIREEGLTDELVAEFERFAEAAPHDPDAQVDLGNAYVQKIFDVGQGPLAGVYGQKADEAFDLALALDETHWEARFTKAVSLSNWPAFLGKQPEAIRQYEILRQQQEAGTAQSHHAQTYYYLGNMYQQTGDPAKALAAWRDGLARFPDNDLLRQQLAFSEN